MYSLLLLALGTLRTEIHLISLFVTLVLNTLHNIRYFLSKLLLSEF